MQVTVQNKPEQSQVELTIAVTPDELKPFITKAAEKISKDHPIKGFRPGKVPVKVVAEKFGQEPLLHEALDRAVPHFFVEAILEESIDAVTRPAIAIKKSSFDGPLEFIATVDVLPQVKLGDPKKIKAEKKAIEVSDEHIDKELEYLAKGRATVLDVARPAQVGDTVTIDFNISIDGETIEGGESKEHPVPLGEGHFLPDFEKGLTGISAGDTRAFDLSFPTDYPKETLRGQKAQARVKAHRVQQRVLPKIDDAFAKGLGKFDNLQQLKDKLKENMKEEKHHREKERHLSEIAEKYSELTTIGLIPKALIDRDIDSRLQELAQMLSIQGKTIQDYLIRQRKSLDQVREDMRETAEKNVRVGLTLRQFAKENAVEVSDEEVEEEVVKQVQQFGSPEKAEKEIDMEHLKEHITATLRNRKVLEKLAELAAQ
ncbi:MAG: trigger factor [Candidatus Andersenbacteria bacterium]|nr:trigger factor [Candidatus Andersenbacteria bacterium]MBI3250682.1 trigger factor [Candidatus Andersenbacteria bacterium]